MVLTTFCKDVFLSVASFYEDSLNGNINLLSPLQGLKNLIEELLGDIFIALFQNGKYQIILMGEGPSIL